MCQLIWNLGTSTSWNPQGLPRPIQGLLIFYLYHSITWWLHIYITGNCPVVLHDLFSDKESLFFFVFMKTHLKMFVDVIRRNEWGRQHDIKQRQKFISLSYHFLQDELNVLHIDVQGVLIALQEEGLMTPTIVMNCVNWFYDTAVRYRVHQWIRQFCNTFFSDSAILGRMPLSPLCCQL
jgi:hypothetical protein